MGRGDGAYDRQAKARAARGAVARGVEALEAAKHALALRPRDPRTVVLDAEADPGVGQGARMHAHQALARGGVRDGVCEQVA